MMKEIQKRIGALSFGTHQALIPLDVKPLRNSPRMTSSFTKLKETKLNEDLIHKDCTVLCAPRIVHIELIREIFLKQLLLILKFEYYIRYAAFI